MLTRPMTMTTITITAVAATVELKSLIPIAVVESVTECVVVDMTFFIAETVLY